MRRGSSYEPVKLSHSVDVGLFEFAQFPAEVDVDLEVEVTLVAVVGLHAELPEEFLALLASDVVLQVEDGLLPVSVRRFGGRREPDSLVAFGELDVEERHQSLKRENGASTNKRK